MSKFYLILFVLIFQGVITGMAQINLHTIRGTILDEQKEPIPGAVIKIEGGQWATVTNHLGQFRLERIPAGKYSILLSYVGFKPMKKELTLSSTDVNVIYTMEQSEQKLNEVVVLGKSDASILEESSKAVAVIETRVARLQTSDLGDVLNTASGVNVRRSGGLGSQNRFSLNGLTDDQIRFMLDGIPLDIMGYSSGIANVPVNLVERVDIYKGVVPVDLGADALGGAVNLISTSRIDSNLGSVSYQVGSFGTHRFSLEGQSKTYPSGLYIRGNAFSDYSRNNYLVDVEVAGEGGKLSEVTVPRFHDAYKSYGFRGTIGLTDRSWAEEISLEVFSNHMERDIQNNNVMSIVYGEITSENKNNGALLRYRQHLTDHLTVKIAGGYTFKQVYFTDTSRYIYTWHGDVVRDENGIAKERSPGELGQATDRQIWDHNTYGRIRLDYELSPLQSLRLSVAPTYISRSGDEKWNEEAELKDPLNEINTILTWVNGLEYRLQDKKEKIENSLFSKHYFQSVRAEEPTSTNGITRNIDRQSHNYGVGNNFRYHITPQWMLKISYEWTTRLPKPQEIFGNGVLILPNFSLKPERSHNANLSLQYSSTVSSKNNWKIGLNTFLRETDQLILLLGNNEVFSYQNVFAARSIGLEANAFWKSSNNRLQVSANTTFQDFRNRSSMGSFGPYFGDRIPNRPYFFINNSINYNLPELTYIEGELNFYFKFRYVHDFYKGWEGVGLKQYKDIIPTQLTQNIGATYQVPVKRSKASLSTEIQNLTNAKVYDFFGVQKPGRAIYIKLTTSF